VQKKTTNKKKRTRKRAQHAIHEQIYEKKMHQAIQNVPKTEFSFICKKTEYRLYKQGRLTVTSKINENRSDGAPV
jgi:hypothetical protein